MTIKIVSYNIHGGRGVDGVQDYSRIGRFLAQRGADIVLLQEMDTRPLQRNTEQDLADLRNEHFSSLVPSPAVYGQHGWYGNALLTRFPVVFSQTIDVSQYGRQPRNIQEVILSTGEGLLQILNTHKGLKRIERREQIKKLGIHLQQPTVIPIVVGGDFNEWQLFSRHLRKLNQVLTPHPVGPSFPTRWPFLRLDRFWSRPGDFVQSARVLKTPETRFFSDHYPIEMNVVLQGNT